MSAPAHIPEALIPHLEYLSVAAAAVERLEFHLSYAAEPNASAAEEYRAAFAEYQRRLKLLDAAAGRIGRRTTAQRSTYAPQRSVLA